MFARLAKKTTKYACVAGAAVGGVKLGIIAINDDMDDIPYYFKQTFRWRGSEDVPRKKVVVLGSGWGALSFVKKLDSALYDVTVVSPRPFFFYTPLLCGSTTGTVSPGAIIEPIRDNAPGCNYLLMACKDVNLQDKKVVCTGTGSEVTLDYDHLVVAVGMQPNTFGIPGVDKHAMFLKEIEHGREVRRRLLNRIEEARVALQLGQEDRAKKLMTMVVVGGGPTGVEFCGELADFIKKDLSHSVPEMEGYFNIKLIEALPGLLTMFQKEVGEYVKEHLESQGVDVRLNAMVKQAEEDKVMIKNKDGSMETIDFGGLVWVAGVGMRPFTKALCQKIGPDAGQTDRRGLVVDGAMRVKGTKLGEVFALGDCAVAGKPPTAQVAAQQGKFLGRMFRRGNEHQIIDEQASTFEYNHQGTMAYIGDSQAATELFPNGLVKLGRSSITDHMWWRSLYGECDHVRVMGMAGFAVWRSVYFSKLYSGKGRWCVASDWLRTSLFGRPSASSAQGTASMIA